MRFDDLDAAMRRFETAHDHCVLPDIYMVARLDGRSFTRLTKKQCDFEAPFDERFRDIMVETVKHLMEEVGIQIVYGFTESDEISLLIHREDTSFDRKLRKLNSILAGEASAKFTNLLGKIACFDCRISQLPTVLRVVDYFRWRSEDAHRNSLNAHCYWLLRHEGKSPRTATSMIEGKSIAEKNELLFQAGVNFNDLPSWQKRGVGVIWDMYKKEGFNPKTNETTLVDRRSLKTIWDLPLKDAYSEFIEQLCN